MKLREFQIKDMIFLLLVFYPILPTNKYIGMLSLSNIDTMLITVLYFCANRSIVNVFHYAPFHWLYLIVYALFCLSTATAMAAVSWLCSTFLVSIVLISIIRDEKDIHRCINCLAIGSFLMSIIGLTETVTSTYLIQGDLYVGWSDSLRYGFLRCAGSFGHPINFGFFQAIVALILFHQIKTKDLMQKQKWRYILVYCLAVASMMCTVSRLPILFFVVAQSIYIVQMGVKKALKYFLIMLLTLFGFLIVAKVCEIDIFLFVFDFFASVLKLLGISSQIDYSAVKGFGNRVDLYKWVIDAVDSNWIFGKGINATFSYKMTSLFTKTSIEVHYLYIFFRCGIIGLFFLVAGYFSILLFLKKAKRMFSKKEYEKSFIRILSIIMPLYYICLFGVQETDTTKIVCEIIAIGIANVRCVNKKMERENV